MAGNKRPSFLKRQKEQKRLERAAEKREARVRKREARANGLDENGASEFAEESIEGVEEAMDLGDEPKL